MIYFNFSFSEIRNYQIRIVVGTFGEPHDALEVDVGIVVR
jgi:hypothetical protein